VDKEVDMEVSQKLIKKTILTLISCLERISYEGENPEVDMGIEDILTQYIDIYLENIYQDVIMIDKIELMTDKEREKFKKVCKEALDFLEQIFELYPLDIQDTIEELEEVLQKLQENAEYSPDKREVVFVYGTLRKGYGNHRLLEEGNAFFIGDAVTEEKYKLTASGIPFVSKSEPICQIKGELYNVDGPTLRRLDQLEGHPNFYYREQIPVLVGDKMVYAWIYFCDTHSGTVIPSGDYNDYRKIGGIYEKI
jgi:gamma-glutamylcyclotransferase (GGCT)/AIG2-like uncharacterized protein YtfP